MYAKRPRRLDFNAPLLSTRRPSTATASVEISRSNSLNGSCFRVPFSWEQSPGKPKDIGVRNENNEEKGMPLPKPPPVRWLEESMLAYDDDFDANVDVSNVNIDINDIDNHAYESEKEDEDEDEEDDDNDTFSDAIDLFSLAESLNINDDKSEIGSHTGENEDIQSEISTNYERTTSPNFMIQKFLPAATALAAASSLCTTGNGREIISTNVGIKKLNVSVNQRSKARDGSRVPRRARQAYTASSTRGGCGLEMLFPWPWRAKHKLCGVKSPVRNAHSSLKSHFSPSNSK